MRIFVEHDTALNHSHSFLTLPVEILDHVVQHLDLLDKISLARCSSRFNGLCTRLIYRDVAWSRWPQALQCCRTLLKCPRTSQAVRRLSISFDSPPPNLLQNAYKMLSTALRQLTQLTTLSAIAMIDAYFSIVLAPCRFPHLVDLSLALPIPRSCTAFLARHPGIRYLQIHPIPMGAPMSPALGFDSIPSIALPALHSLIAPQPWILKLVGSASRLESAVVFWDLRFPCDPRAVLAGLGAPGYFVSVTHGWREDVMEAAVEALPNLTRFTLRSSMRHTDAKSLLAGLKHYLPRWKRLIRLNIVLAGVSKHERPVPPTEAVLEAGFATVTRLGELCPSLRQCTLPSDVSFAGNSSGTNNTPTATNPPGAGISPTTGNPSTPRNAPSATDIEPITWTRPILSDNAWFPQVAPAIKYKFIARGIFLDRYPPALLARAGFMTVAQTESLQDDLKQLRETGLSPRQIAEMVSSLMMNKRRR